MGIALQSRIIYYISTKGTSRGSRAKLHRVENKQHHRARIIFLHLVRAAARKSPFQIFIAAAHVYTQPSNGLSKIFACSRNTADCSPQKGKKRSIRVLVSGIVRACVCCFGDKFHGRPRNARAVGHH